MNPRAFYQPGVPENIKLPSGSLIEMLEKSVEESSDRVALDFFGHTTTYRQLGNQISRAAEGLRRLGVGRGDRVAVVLPNCPQHVVAFYAILRLGAIVVEHNPLYTARELRHMFEDHAARVVIVWDVAVEKLRNQPHDIELDHIISVNMLTEFPISKRLALKLPLPPLRAQRRKLTAKVKHTLTWKDLLNHRPIKRNHPRPSVGDIAVIQYTSGTTGLPKGAMLTHSNLYCNSLMGQAWTHDAQIGKEVFYGVLPFFHAFGTTVTVVFGILQQARIHLFPTFDVNLVLSAAKKDPPTFFCAVPPIFEAIAIAAKRKKVSFAASKFCICGAMSLPDSTRELWESISGGPLVEGYGMTESSPVALGNPFYSTRRPGTVGLPFPSTETRVVSVEDSSVEVAQGERGELLIRGPQVFSGYWNNPEETEKALLPGGWLATGDIVTQDEDGFTTIVDRKKELIITSGFNVAPTEVESILKSHPAIADAAVVGLPNPHSGEEVVAAVVVDPGHKLDPAEVRTFCKQRLAAYKVPRRIFTVDSLPKSLLGKVLRAEVRKELLARS